MGKKRIKREILQHPAGDEAEQVFEEGLKALIELDPFFKGWHHARKNGELDGIQIDYLVFCGNEGDVLIAIPYQIKGGNHASEAIEKHWKKHPGIAPFSIKMQDKENPVRVAIRVQRRSYRYIRNLLLRTPYLQKRLAGILLKKSAD